MHRSKLLKGLHIGVLATCLAALPAAIGQVVTTSSLTGSVVSEQGQSIKSAVLTITHQPTGTVYKVSSRADGSFSLNGLRPGGPYTVLVHSEGNRDSELKEVYLEIDRGADVTLKVAPADVTVMDKFEVTSSAVDQLFNTDQTGSSTFISAKQIANMPVGDRSINSLTRLDARITYNRDPNDRAISVSGMNNRYNMIQVDGVNASDPFGLNSNNTAAERNVIPMDSLDSISINTAPYNARNAGFVGAQINAVTKSGTNDFHGSLYGTYRAANGKLFGSDYRLTGEWLDGTLAPITNYTERTYGATLGGPILKNKLFFYISWEKVNEDRIAPRPNAFVADSNIQAIINKATELGFKVGSPTPPAANKLKDDNVIVKLDYQINSQHRATLRYNEVSSSRPTFPNMGGSGSSQNNFSFDSSWYQQKSSDKAIIGQLISTWTDKLSTELSLSRSTYHSEPKNNSVQPFVEIKNVPVPGTTYTSYVYFGTERSRHFNILDTTTDSAELLGTYQLTDKHKLQTGFQFDTADIYNAYVQDHYGYYSFASLDSFLNYASKGGAPAVSGTNNTYSYNAFNAGVDPAATFTEQNLGLFINDNWKPVHGLSLDMGVRIDMPNLPDAIPYNDLFTQTFGVRNDSSYDGAKVLQPRVGFNWQPDTKLRTTVRGGVGLFYGRAPRVWISNSYSNTGMNYTTYSGTNATMPAINSNADAQVTTGSATPKQTVAFMDPKFKLPSRWKANLAVDRELGFWDLKGSVEYELTQVNKDVFYTNVNLVQTSTGPDGRAMYWDKANAVTVSGTGAVTQSSQGTRFVSTKFAERTIELTNTNKGGTKSLVLSLERPRKNDGWYWKASYVNTDAKEVLYGSSSVASSSWNNRTIFNTADQELATATLEVKDKFLINVTKDIEYFKGYKTTFGVLYEGRSGYPFSFAYTGDANGDFQSGNDLLYVPVRGDSSKVRFATFADEQNFWNIVDRFDLKQGEAVKANDHRYPWVNQYDVSLKQEVKLPGWKHKLILGADILNIGNMLNDKWGLIRGSNQYFVRRESVATVNYDAVNKQYVYSKVSTSLGQNSFNPDRARGEPAATRWTVLFSAKYEF